MLLITIIIAFIALIVASLTDIKNREVPDYVSYILIFVALTSALLQTIIEWNYIPVAQSAMGMIIGLVIAYAMFYLGQWGGGDSKLMMGLGAVIGFNVFPIFGENNYWLLLMIANIILLGAVYGLTWSIFLAVKNRKEFMKGMKSWFEKREILIIRRVLLIIIAVLLIIVLTLVPQEYKSVMILSLATLYVIFYIWLFVKVIEETCMIKDIPISKLTEGDWIYKNVYIGKKLITGPKDLGISREQIAQLKKYSAKGKIKTVTIKEGIPFIPVFLLAYIATIVLYYVGIF
jgi:hypothetical protein